MWDGECDCESLLDTHSLVWADSVSYPTLLRARAAGRRRGRVDSVILVSAASAWEIATKVRLGKFARGGKLEAVFMKRSDEAGYELLADHC